MELNAIYNPSSESFGMDEYKCIKCGFGLSVPTVPKIKVYYIPEDLKCYRSDGTIDRQMIEDYYEQNSKK